MRLVKVLLAFVVFALLFLFSLTFVVGCGHSSTSPEASTPEETWVLSENDKFAAKLGKDIKGILTDHEYDVPAGEQNCPSGGAACVASGWYFPGKAFYYRPYINTYSFDLLSDIAAHEVCHSVSLGHDALHRNCILSLGRTPTYAGDRRLLGTI